MYDAAPPFHLAHATADEAVPAGQSRRLAEALRERGASVELDLVADAGHLWSGPVDGEHVFTRAVDFAQRVTAR